MTEEMIQLAADIGFALASMKAFMTPSGVEQEIVLDAIDRLEQSLQTINAILKDKQYN